MALFAGAMALLFASSAAPAEEAHDDEHDHDRARRALEAGEVLPLRTILQTVERDHPGQVMEVELEQHDGRWIYEIKLLKKGGALVKLKLDARDGRLVAEKAKSKSSPGGGR